MTGKQLIDRLKRQLRGKQYLPVKLEGTGDVVEIKIHDETIFIRGSDGKREDS